MNIPVDLKVGYELNLGLAMNYSQNGRTWQYFPDRNPYFSFFTENNRLKCCGNTTTGDPAIPGEAVIGYVSLGIPFTIDSDNLSGLLPPMEHIRALS